MATRDTTSRLTYAEYVKRIDPKGDAAEIAEVLAEENPWLDDAPWEEANNFWHHQITRQLSLPSGTWRSMNQGVTTEAAQTVNVNEPLALLEGRSHVDKKWVDSSPNPKKARNDEAMMHIEGLQQSLGTAFFYGNNATNPNQFNGLAPRLASVGNNVRSAGGTGSDLTSAFIIQWGRKAFMAHPPGLKSTGITHNDLGFHDVLVDTTYMKYLLCYVDQFEWQGGLVVRDERCIARLCNLEIATSGTGAFDEDDFIWLINALPSGGGNAVIYANKELKSIIDIKAKDAFSLFKIEDFGGKPVTSFRGVPIRRCDAILSTETALS